MAIGTDHSRAIRIVEEHEFARDFVLVGRDALAENAQRWIAIAFAHIAQHLVIGAVLFDDINDVLKQAGFADALRHWPRRLASPGWQSGLFQQRIAHVQQSRAC